MSKLYAVVQVCPERHYNYKMDEIRESFSVGLPYIFTDRKRAYQEAEKKRKAHVPCFVKEFPCNPLDKRIENLEAKVHVDSEYIADLEQSVKELEEENARLRSCPSDDVYCAKELGVNVREKHKQMPMGAYEDAIKRFLRKISPERDWQYIGEVEHAWMAELHDELVAEFKVESHKLRELVRDAWGDGHPDKSCGDCEIRDECHAEIEEAHKKGNGRWNTRCLFERRIEERMRELGIEVKE